MNKILSLIFLCGLCWATTLPQQQQHGRHESPSEHQRHQLATHLVEISTNKLHPEQPDCPPGMELNPLWRGREKRGDDAAHAAKCLLIGTAIKTALNMVGGGGQPPPTKPPNFRKDLPPDLICLNDDGDETDDDVREEADQDVNARFFTAENRNIRFKSAQVFTLIPVPQNLNQLQLPFNHNQMQITQDVFNVVGTLIELRHANTQMWTYFGRINSEINRVSQMQESRIQKIMNTKTKQQIKAFIKKIGPGSCVGFNRDFALELQELVRQRELIRHAIR